MKNVTEYMWYLLSAPFKAAKKQFNQFYIICKVFGKLFDEALEAVNIARLQSTILTADASLLAEYGKERGMAQLNGETLEDYRIRLLTKPMIAKMAGTENGILYTLKMLGYDKSSIEPYTIYDPQRWAEFIVYIKGSNPTITDINIIHKEVYSVKPARSLPTFESENYNTILFTSSEFSFDMEYPVCGELICGTYPEEE